MRFSVTTQQRRVFDFLVREIGNGKHPSLQEIADAHGLRSLATVHKHIVGLRDAGYIRWAWNRKRSIEIVPPPDCCQTCGRKFEAKDGAAA